jgi:nucleotide-binding universal stress UspA family protein
VSRRIVVGVSGRSSTLVAIDWALEYAQNHDGLAIELVHVIEDSWGFVPREIREGVAAQAQSQTDELIERVRLTAPGVTITKIVSEGQPISRLVERTDDAELLAVATHPLRRFGNQVFSTGAAQIAARAHCSVAVIPDLQVSRGHKPLPESLTEPPPESRSRRRSDSLVEPPLGQRTASSRPAVVVGVDGSPTSDLAVQFAADEAARKQVPLVVVYSWRMPSPMIAADMESGWLHEPTPADGRVLTEAVRGLPERYPGLEIVLEMTGSAPIDALRDAAKDAQLLVIGTHGRQGLSRFWLGSVSHQILLAMPCPVVVVRPPQTPLHE